MPFVEFVCIKCGYLERCVAKIYAREFKGKPAPPLCLQGLTTGIDSMGEPKDKAEFEYVQCVLNEV